MAAIFYKNDTKIPKLRDIQKKYIISTWWKLIPQKRGAKTCTLLYKEKKYSMKQEMHISKRSLILKRNKCFKIGGLKIGDYAYKNQKKSIVEWKIHSSSMDTLIIV